jgi:hypothetical protein
MALATLAPRVCKILRLRYRFAMPSDQIPRCLKCRVRMRQVETLTNTVAFWLSPT